MAAEAAAAAAAVAASAGSQESIPEIGASDGGDAVTAADHHQVFVYGTLLSNLRNHHIMTAQNPNEKVRLVGPAVTAARMTMFVQNADDPAKACPFVDPDIKQDCIVGELYACNDPVLARIDSLEGHPDWYRREECVIIMETPRGGAGAKKTVKAQIYVNRLFRQFGMHEEAIVAQKGDFRAVMETPSLIITNSKTDEEASTFPKDKREAGRGE